MMSRCHDNTSLYSTSIVPFFHHGSTADASLARVGRYGPESTPTTEIIMPAKAGGFPSLEGLTTREAFVGPVPVADLVLAELPAQEHDFVSADSRKVEEAFLERLDLRAGLVDQVGALCDGTSFPFDRRRGLA
jgi:hypothetical protein